MHGTMNIKFIFIVFPETAPDGIFILLSSKYRITAV